MTTSVRRRHFGSVRKRASGRWQATYWHDGRLHNAPSTFGAKTDALAWLSAIETNIRSGSWVDPIAGKVTVKDFTVRWVAQRADLRPTTRAKYQRLLDGHVFPVLGNRPLAGLTPSAVRNW